MKLPRWVVIGMLATSMLAVVVSAAFWWVTWPERTAREFVQLVLERDFQRIRPMIQEESQDGVRHSVQVLFELDDIPDKWTQNELRPQKRSWADIIRAHQEFSIINDQFEFLGKSIEIPRYSFGVRRGTILEASIYGGYDILRFGEPEPYWLD